MPGLFAVSDESSTVSGMTSSLGSNAPSPATAASSAPSDSAGACDSAAGLVRPVSADATAAMTLAARNAIEFLSSRAKLTPHDAYALCSIAVSFRVTQVVDIVRGVHAMIPKSLFTGELRRQIAVV